MSSVIDLNALLNTTPLHGQQKFTYTGVVQTFTVPTGVTTIYVSGCGGGGGGSSAYGGFHPGSNGGATSMGVSPTILFTLAGGGGTGASGGFGGQDGTTATGSGMFGPTGYGYGSGGFGAGSFNGGAGRCYYCEPVTVTPGTTYPITIGNGGAGGIGTGGNGTAGQPGFLLIQW